MSLIQTEVKDGAVTGSLTTSEINDDYRPGSFSAGEPLDSTVIALTGTLNGSRVMLKFDSLLTSVAVNGTLEGTTLHLRVPQKDGTVADYVFKPGTVEQYNTEVNQMKADLTDSG